MPLKVGSFTSTNLKYLTIGTQVKFKPRTGYVFDTEQDNKQVIPGDILKKGEVLKILKKTTFLTEEASQQSVLIEK